MAQYRLIRGRCPNRNAASEVTGKCYPTDQLMHRVMDWFVRQPPPDPAAQAGPRFRSMTCISAGGSSALPSAGSATAAWLAPSPRETRMAQLRLPRIARLSGAAADTCFRSLRVSDRRGKCWWRLPCLHESALLLVGGPNEGEGGRRDAPRRWRGAGQGPLEHVGPLLPSFRGSAGPRVRGRRAGDRSRGEALARCRRAARSRRRRCVGAGAIGPVVDSAKSDRGEISAAWLAVVGPELLVAQAATDFDCPHNAQLD